MCSFYTANNVEWWNTRSESRGGENTLNMTDDHDVGKCVKSLARLGYLNWRLPKKSFTVSTNVGTVPGLFLGESKETRFWAFVPVIAAWISSTMRSGIRCHVVVVVWHCSPVGGACETVRNGARWARPSSAIFKYIIVGVISIHASQPTFSRWDVLMTLTGVVTGR